MSEIRKLKIRSRQARKNRSPKIVLGSGEAQRLVEEIEKLESSLEQEAQDKASLALKISQLREQITKDNNEQKLVNISGGNFTNE